MEEQPTYVNVFPEYATSPLWTDGEPSGAALRSVGIDDALHDAFQEWNREWIDLASSDVGLVDDWSDVTEVQPWLERGRHLVKRLRDVVPASITVRYFDHFYGEWTVIEKWVEPPWPGG